jgi:hypothetical protein
MGVYKWTDKRFATSLLGIKGHNGIIIDAILKINRQHKNIHYPLTIHDKIGDHNINDLNFYIDFECVNNIDNSIINVDGVKGAMIYLIGVGWICPDTRIWKYKYFIVDHLDYRLETKIVYDWLLFMNSIRSKYNRSNNLCRLYHWSNAEVNHLDNAIKRLNNHLNNHLNECDDNIGAGSYNVDFSKYIWHDLMRIFQNVPIVIKGCLTYGLKNIAKMMHANGLIETNWDVNSSIDGMGAMVIALQCNKFAIDDKKNLIDYKDINDVVKYNEVDCKVLYDILKYITTH